MHQIFNANKGKIRKRSWIIKKVNILNWKKKKKLLNKLTIFSKIYSKYDLNQFRVITKEKQQQQQHTKQFTLIKFFQIQIVI